MIERSPLVKIAIPVTRNHAGFPPIEVEWVWAIPSANESATIDNVPFFSDWAYQDICQVREEADGLHGTSLLRSSGNRTLLIECDDKAAIERIRSILRRLEVAHEAWGTKLLLAVNIAAGACEEVLIDSVFLEAGSAARRFDWR